MNRNRLSPSALNSLDASLIGFVMAGCIGMGYFAGNWLDGRLGTQYWTPILVVVGVVAGARQMWITVSRIRKSFTDGSFDKLNGSEFRKSEAQDVQQRNRAANADPSHRKPRFFNVPPPPNGSESTPPTGENETAFNDQLAELKNLQAEIDQIEKKDESD
ncbi:MAG: AtpZ/AtpI family protein [Abditibacteriaceae bacterium]